MYYLQAWVPEGKSFYTRCCNPPVQGACADAAMLALAYVDDRLFEAGIDGGPVAWLHDEIVLEVREDQAERAAEILKQAMIDGFAETFPGAPLNGLVEPHIGMSWGEAKAPKPAPSPAAALDLGRIYFERLRVLAPDAGLEEGGFRAFDYAVGVGVQHGVGLAEAKQQVMDAMRTRE